MHIERQSCTEIHGSPLIAFIYCGISGQEFEVEPTIEQNGTGSVCDGRETVRLYKGPTDSCGNTADDITQTIIIKDDESPNFTKSELEDMILTCPNQYSSGNMTEPQATDDCDENVKGTYCTCVPWLYHQEKYRRR